MPCTNNVLPVMWGCCCGFSVQGGGQAWSRELDQLGEGSGPNDVLLLGSLPGEKNVLNYFLFDAALGHGRRFYRVVTFFYVCIEVTAEKRISIVRAHRPHRLEDQDELNGRRQQLAATRGSTTYIVQ